MSTYMPTRAAHGPSHLAIHGLFYRASHRRMVHPPAAEWSSPSKVTPEEATTGEQQHNNNNSGYAITREIAKHDDWNSTEIRKRCKEMAREAISLWPLPKKYNEDVAASAWQIMDDSTEDLFNHLCEIIKESVFFCFLPFSHSLQRKKATEQSPRSSQRIRDLSSFVSQQEIKPAFWMRYQMERACL